jgi:hypothetical protein
MKFVLLGLELNAVSFNVYINFKNTPHTTYFIENAEKCVIWSSKRDLLVGLLEGPLGRRLHV